MQQLSKISITFVKKLFSKSRSFNWTQTKRVLSPISCELSQADTKMSYFLLIFLCYVKPKLISEKFDTIKVNILINLNVAGLVLKIMQDFLCYKTQLLSFGSTAVCIKINPKNKIEGKCLVCIKSVHFKKPVTRISFLSKALSFSI